MSKMVISVTNLSKRYTIRHQNGYDAGFRHVVHNFATAPVRWLREKRAERKKQRTNRLPINGNGKGENPRFESRDSKSTETEEFWALKDVSFEVERGEVVGIIGRNGAGKSTLLKILSRITEPTEGRARIRGRVASLLEVGTGFHPELTGRENIFVNGAVLGMTRAEVKQRFDKIVAFAEVERFLDTPVKWYSSGMYVRLAFAVAAHLEPEILLVDEVLAVGDVAFQKKCLGKMSSVAKEGRTVLFVSHNLNAVEELCESVVFLERGRVARLGKDVRNIINAYTHDSDGLTLSGLWVNPDKQLADSCFTPLRFTLTDESGNALCMPVRNDAQIWVQVEGIIGQLDPAMNIGYALYSEEGHLLYWSLTSDGPERDWPRFQAGACRLRSQIPPRLLNEGDYRLELTVTLHFREWIVEPGVNAPSLLLSIRGGLSDSPYWRMRRSGILGPVLPWTYRTIETTAPASAKIDHWDADFR